jgi:hypothetical protein
LLELRCHESVISGRGQWPENPNNQENLSIYLSSTMSKTADDGNDVGDHFTLAHNGQGREIYKSSGRENERVRVSARRSIAYKHQARLRRLNGI